MYIYIFIYAWSIAVLYQSLSGTILQAGYHFGLLPEAS